ncbi:MAG: D-alanine--D-alanine ligase family protein [Schaalia hyovaginalis]|uniref:D-alanine--D-alanine ligase family protein n=1 Tax=Schaalia hyovaginalis TaxID=29316 RepID=UPI002A91C03A|nr:D-alanine--D-alanine ligase family protein [Schaalia hyovaginalis]MDY6214771.1 D-alanine--D-alanine ligase family protein [Schaalia hyovaginalis]
MTSTSTRRVLIVFGGRSSEHEVSCATTAGILRAIDRSKWDVVPVGITRDGEWVRVADDPSALEFRDGHGQSVTAGDSRVILASGGALFNVSYEADPACGEARVREVEDLGRVDVVLPLLHGPYGEDGTIQGLFEMANVPYVGCGVTASAISMDKHLTKTVLAAAGIDVGSWELVTRVEWEEDPAAVTERIGALGYPVFVKPCRAGSSIGISKVEDEAELAVAMKEAQNHDPRVIVEAMLPGREIECGVLGSASSYPRTAPLGEIELPEGEFYDYELKYVDTEAIGLVCPARVRPEHEAAIRETAAKAFEALECEGLARVDFFYDEDSSRIIINEVNTLPGFTPVSMFPQMWGAAGLDYTRLIDVLLEEALLRPPGLR